MVFFGYFACNSFESLLLGLSEHDLEVAVDVELEGVLSEVLDLALPVSFVGDRRHGLAVLVILTG